MSKRKNGEGTWGEKTIKGLKYKFYRNSNGKYTYGKTVAEIKKKLATKMDVVEIEQRDITFGDYILEWLNGIKSTIEITTYNSYEDAINTRLIDFTKYDLANVEMSMLTDKMFQDYLNTLAKEYSLNSISKTWSLIKRCISYAEIRNDIKPLHLRELVRTPSESNVCKKKKKIAVPTKNEIELIYKESIKKDSNGNNHYGNAAQVIILIMYTGLRTSEALGLKWDSVDLDKKEIRISESLAKIREKDQDGNNVYFHKAKSTKSKKSNRIVPLPNRAIAAIQHFLQYKKSSSSFVCVNSKNQNHYTRRQIEKTLSVIIENSDCLNKTYTPHCLRHGYGSILLSQGVDIKIVSELLGHEDVYFTYNVYIEIFKSDKRDAIKKLE